MVLQAQKLLVAITLAALVIAALACVYVVARFVAPLRKLTHGGAAHRGGRSHPGDPGHLRRRGGRAGGGLRADGGEAEGVLRALQESVLLLTNAGTELSQATDEQSQTITRQAAALQETQVTAQEIKQTSLLAAQKAETVLRLTEQADAGLARRARRPSRSRWAGLTDIRAQVDEIAQKIAQLAERTQQIGGITQTVKDLADQSNMLALNAAIEAVRSRRARQGLRGGGAGDSLAGRPVHPGHEPGARDPRGHRRRHPRRGEITERGSQQMEGGPRAGAARRGENLRELSTIVQDNSVGGAADRRGGDQQNAGIAQIFSAVTDQTRMMDETMRRLETTTDAASTLKGLSDRVSEVVGRFRV